MLETETSSKPQFAAFDRHDYMFSIEDFCKTHKISRAKLYELWQQGQGPKFKKVGKRTLITAEAAAEWRNAPDVAV